MKNFISVADCDDPKGLIQLAKMYKTDPLMDSKLGAGKTIALVFLNPSLRTRLSSQKAANNLGLQVMVVNLNQDGWAIEFEDGTVMDQGSQEHIKEAAGVISQYCDIIGMRTFPGLEKVSDDYSENILSKFLAHATVPVVSLESATRHPLQSVADWLTISEQARKPKPKVVLSWAPHPRKLPQAVANSFVEWMQLADVDLHICNPIGFDLSPEFVKDTPVHHNQLEAFENADFIYAKNWSAFEPYGATSTNFGDWQVDTKKMGLTNNAKFMHCLPVRRNVVVQDAVIDGPNSLVLHQALNRTFAAQAVFSSILKGIYAPELLNTL